MTLAPDELTRCFTNLPTKPVLLVSDPAEPRRRVGSSHLWACALRSDQSYAPIRRMHGQMDVLDILARHGDPNFAQVDRLGHQYPGWCFTRSNSACVAARLRSSSGNNAFSTCASRAWS